MTTRQKRITELQKVKDLRTATRLKTKRNGRTPKLLVGVKNILVPTDFSERSFDALAYAENIAEMTGSKLTLISVVQPLVLPVPVMGLAMENDRIIKGTQKKLNDLAVEHGIVSEMLDRVVVSQGAAWDEIVRAARNLKCDLIVIATHGHTGVTRAILGSTAERVVRHAHCPVLVVR